MKKKYENWVPMFEHHRRIIYAVKYATSNNGNKGNHLI